MWRKKSKLFVYMRCTTSPASYVLVKPGYEGEAYRV